MENTIVDIESQIRSVKELCREHVDLLDDTEERALMTAAAEVLNGLEKAIHQCFQDDRNHVTSPKSIEPWD
jgi:hypothetical protein